ncbi:MAG: hypothetical protein ACK5LK_01100 [Chthoniobacterales bacterium]
MTEGVADGTDELDVEAGFDLHLYSLVAFVYKFFYVLEDVVDGGFYVDAYADRDFFSSSAKCLG